MTPRGIRNNNPGNIRISAQKYAGEIVPSNDRAFKQFRSMAYGIRAIFVILKTYQIRYGLRTVAQMIGRWAPPSENDTRAYSASVAKAAGRAPDDVVDAERPDDMIPFVRGMIRVENGQDVDESDITEGWKLFRELQ